MQRLFGIVDRRTDATLQAKVAAQMRQDNDMNEIHRRIERINEELALRERRQWPREIV